MAIGIPFDEANAVLRAPTPEDAAAGTVYDLHVHRYRDLDRQPNVISKWQLTPGELAEVIATGALWFNCWGNTHPPIWISGHDPFRHADLKAAEGEPGLTGAGTRTMYEVDPAEVPNHVDPTVSAERFIRIVAECSPDPASQLDHTIIDVARRIVASFDAKAAA